VSRLFTTFASGASGYGLLVLRLVLAASVIAEGLALVGRDLGGPDAAPFAVVCDAILLLCGTCIGLGLLTPVVQTVVATVKLAGIAEWTWRLAESLPAGPVQLLILQLAIAGSLALIGPGAYSIDARIFGRQEIRIPPRTRFPTR
jgi:uncharacterized membrane protein YphA (DoxX/SURF4 family)